jgi:hypothetical protein
MRKKRKIRYVKESMREVTQILEMLRWQLFERKPWRKPSSIPLDVAIGFLKMLTKTPWST